jgi:hypothetical protein
MKAWGDMWEHYVPTFRDEAHPDSFAHPQGLGFSVRGRSSRNAVGSNADVTNIFAHLIQQREALIIRGEKTRVTKKLAQFITDNPDKDFAELGNIPMVKYINDDGFVEERIDPLWKDSNIHPEVVFYRDNGKDKAIVFNAYNHEAVRLAMSLKNMDGVDLDLVENFVGKGTRWLAAVNTQYNVIFSIVNLMRDVQAGALNLSSTELAGRQKDVLSNVFPALKMTYGVERGKNVNNALSRLYREYELDGGTTGFRDLYANITDRATALESELKALKRGSVSKAAHAVADWLSHFNAAIENSVRFAAYKVAREQGMSREQAASLAKNLTVNFNRKGSYTTKIGAFYAFFNASMQGTARMAETLSGPAGKKIMSGGVGIGALMTLLGIAAMGDDDWDKIPEFIRERSLIIPAPGTDDGYLALPMPLGFHFLPNIGRKAVESVFGSNRISAAKRFGGLLNTAINSFSPLGGGGFAQIVTPTVADPIVSLWRNEDWTGKPIYREDYNKLAPTPGFSRTKDSATAWSKGMTEAINAITGGTKYTSGAWSPTPDQLDYIWGQIWGGTMREASKLEQTLEAPFSDEELPLYKVPLLSRLAGTASGGPAERERYYENVIRMNEHQAELKGIRSAGGNVSEYLKAHPEAKYYHLSISIQKAIKTLNDRRKSMRRHNASHAAIQRINQQIESRMKRLNDAVLNVDQD